MTGSVPREAAILPRERILETARDLFYREGIRAVGVERIVHESGHPRATLYRHFRGKEGLVLAYLAAEDSAIRSYCGSIADTLDAAVRLRAIAVGIAEDAAKHHRRGCPFINAAAEFSDPESAVRRAVSAHRAWFRAMLEQAFQAVGSDDPEMDAATMVAMRDAVLVGSYLDEAAAAQRSFAAGVRRRFGLEVVIATPGWE